jgi:hypothetical protein
MTDRAANFDGVMSSSVRVASVTEISAPSAVHDAAGSAVTCGMRYEFVEIATGVKTCPATD